MLMFESRKPSYGSAASSLDFEMEGSPTVGMKMSRLRRMFRLGRSTSTDSTTSSSSSNDAINDVPEEKQPAPKLRQCGQQAKDIMLQLCAEVHCRVRVTAPNRESSAALALSPYTDDVPFQPVRSGCGHGAWFVEVFDADDSSIVVNEGLIDLHGWGELRLIIEADFSFHVSRVNFLESPIAVSCGY